MAFNHTLSAILRGSWLIDKQWANDHLPLVLLMLQGHNVDFKSQTPDRTGSQVYEQPFAIDPATMRRYETKAYDPRSDRYVDNPNIPKGSVGVIPVTGPITKYNGDCGEPGAIQKNTWLNEMERRDNIGAVVLLADTPGGESRAANTFSSTLKNFSKPTLTYVDGMTASLGMWYSSATDETYLSSETDQLGSIGSYCTLLDFSGYLENQGIKMIDIYAPQSTDKNKDYRDALNGDTSAIESNLKIITNSFINAVKDNRGSKAADNIGAWSTGKMFYAKDAVDVGLADGIKSFDQVVSKAAWLAKRKN
jgi:ClpP class serine protease